MPKRKRAGDEVTCESGPVEFGVTENVAVAKTIQVPGGVEAHGEVQVSREALVSREVQVPLGVQVLRDQQVPKEVQVPEEAQAPEYNHVHEEVVMLADFNIPDEVKVLDDAELPEGIPDDVVVTEKVTVPIKLNVIERLEVSQVGDVGEEFEAPNDCEAIGSTVAPAGVEDPEDIKMLEASLLAEMDGVCCRYSGLSVDHRRPCTSQEDRLCHIAANLKAWNGFLWVFGLELQEDSASQLKVVLASDGIDLKQKSTLEERHQAVTLLYHLLTKHRCVVAVTINDELVAWHEDIVCRAIRRSLGVKRLALHLTSPKEFASVALAAAIVSLTQLQCLHLNVDCHAHLFPDLMPLLAETGSLTTLKATVWVPHTTASIFLAALFRNSSITDLSLTSALLNSGRLAYGPGNPHIALGAYLKLNPSLRSLSLTAPELSPEIDVWTVCDALATNKVLLRLELQVSTLKLEYATAVKRLLYSNKSLRYLRFTSSYEDSDDEVSSKYNYVCSDDEVDSEDNGPLDLSLKVCPRCGVIHLGHTDHVKPWISAVLENETSITELTFSMRGFSLQECQQFCRAITSNKSLRKVILEDLGANALEICCTLVEWGLQDRVIVDSHCVVYYPESKTRRKNCPPNVVPFSMLQIAADRVTTSRNLTHITLRVYPLPCTSCERQLSVTPIVQLIRRATCIKDLTLCMETVCCDMCCNCCWNECGAAICDAVSQNASIRSLTVVFDSQRRVNMSSLASLLSRSRTLRAFMLDVVSHEAFNAFMEELSKQELQKNYTLQRLLFFYHGNNRMRERLSIQDIVHRNRALSKRATRFAMGSRVKYTAEAFEKVSNIPTFLGGFQSAADVLEAQATEVIARRVFQIADFNEFMRLAGVVRAYVECPPRNDDRIQLSDLPEECLRHIRRLLRFSDVLSWSEQEEPV